MNKEKYAVVQHSQSGSVMFLVVIMITVAFLVVYSVIALAASFIATIGSLSYFALGISSLDSSYMLSGLLLAGISAVLIFGLCKMVQFIYLILGGKQS